MGRRAFSRALTLPERHRRTGRGKPGEADGFQSDPPTRPLSTVNLMTLCTPEPEYLLGSFAPRPPMENSVAWSSLELPPVILLIDCEQGLLVDLKLLPELLGWRMKRGEGTILASADLASAHHILKAIQVDLVVVAVADQTSLEGLATLRDQIPGTLIIAIADDRPLAGGGLDPLSSILSLNDICLLSLQASASGTALLREICRRAETIAAEQRLIDEVLTLETAGAPIRVDWRSWKRLRS